MTALVSDLSTGQAVIVGFVAAVSLAAALLSMFGRWSDPYDNEKETKR